LLPILTLSITLAYMVPTSSGPELATETAAPVLLLREGGKAALQYRYTVVLPAGETELSWVPEREGLPRDQAHLALSPSQSATVGGAVVESSRVRWLLLVPQACKATAVVTVPCPDVTWSVAAEGQVNSQGLQWAPLVTIETRAKVPLKPADVVIEDVPPDQKPISLGAVKIEPGTKVQVAVGRAYQVPGKVVVRYEKGWQQPRKVLVLDPEEAVATLGAWGMNSVLVTSGQAPPFSASLTLTPERGAELPLDKAWSVGVKRTVVSETRENLDFDRFGRVQGYDTREKIRLEIVNAAAGEQIVEVVEELPSTWDIVVEPPPDRHWTDRAVLRFTLAPGQRAQVEYTVIKHSGTRVK